MGSEKRAMLPKYRMPPIVLRVAAMVLFTAVVTLTIIYVFHLRPFNWAMLEIAYFYLLVGLLLPQIFIWIPLKKGAQKEKPPWYDILFACLSFFLPLYFFSNSHEITVGWSIVAPPTAIAAAVILWALFIEAARRAAGVIYAAVFFIFSIYPLFSFIMPGPLWAPSDTNLLQLATIHIMGLDSLLGMIMRVFGRLLLGFFIYAIALQAAGAGNLFGEIASVLLKGTRGGFAKIAIISSALLGMVSGSSISNVMTTGAFTIPAMKKTGFPPHLAGAMEACASTGGVIMPPIMGAVAFIMAEFLQVSYATVCIAAIVPSIFYYLTLYVQVDLYCARVKMAPLGNIEAFGLARVKLWRVFYDNLHILISIVVLIYTMFWLEMEAYAPWFSAAVLLMLSMVRRRTRFSITKFLHFVEDCGRVIGELMGILGPLGFIIGSFTLTGVAHSIPYDIVALAGGNLYVMLVMGAIASFILGMGVSIAACYIFLAIVLAPGLIQGGFNPIAAHLFVLYCGLWSYITPPVALSAFAAAGIAEADPMRTGYAAMKLGVANYMVPFFFVISPAIILQGPSVWEKIHNIASCAAGLIMIGVAFEGYIWRLGEIKILRRAGLGAAGFLLGIPGQLTDIIGIGIAAVLIGELARKRRGKYLARCRMEN